MSPRAAAPRRVEELLSGKAGPREIAAYLAARSNLPGPRGNLELAHAFADAAAPHGQKLLPLLTALAAPSAEHAPVNTPEEFPPFCAVVASGGVYLSCNAEGRSASRALIENAARDSRWRMREAAAMALQRIGESDPVELVGILTRWLPRAKELELRAILAALAHPPLLRGPRVREMCIRASRRGIERVAALGAQARKSEGFRALRKGLGYSLSVFAAAFPERGLALLRTWAESRDPDVRWIVRENMKKSRLRKGFPAEVRAIEAALDSGA
jgi:hypothetical protein